MNSTKIRVLKMGILITVTTAFLAACSTTPMSAAKRASFWGTEISSSAVVDRTVQVTPALRQVTLTGGQSIKFVAGDKSFAWVCNGPGAYNFDLKEVAPAGFIDHSIRIYVDQDPNYSGGR